MRQIGECGTMHGIPRRMSSLRDAIEQAGDAERPSRSQRRREALATLGLATQLVALSPGRLARLDMPDDAREAIAEARRTASHVAHKRQLAYVAKQLRRCDDDTLAALHAALDPGGGHPAPDVASQRRLEALRQRLLDEGDTVIAELARQRPGLDRQYLRSLIRQARTEQAQDKPPRAARKILHYLQEL